MYVARERATGVDVPAHLAVRGKRYVCPVCAKPVVLRAGYERTYFAHRAHQADPDCENYHPAFGTTPVFVTPPAIEPIQPKRTPEIGQERADLFLHEDESGIRLGIILPRWSGDNWDGRIEIHGRFGLQRFSSSMLARTCEVAVRPQIDPYVFRMQGDVSEEYWTSISDGVEGLAWGPNLFSGATGRRLEESEQLVEGDAYLALLPPEYEIPVSISSQVSQAGAIGDWSVSWVSVPDQHDGSVRGDLAEWLDRVIHGRNARIALIAPFPHHFDDFGWPVLAAPVERVVLHLPESDEEVMVYTSSGESVYSIVERVLEIRGTSLDSIDVMLGEQLAIKVSIEECPLYWPKGLTLELGSEELPLLKWPKDRPVPRGAYDITIRSPDPSFGRILTITGGAKEVEADGSCVVHVPAGGSLEIDAANFGRLSLAASRSPSLATPRTWSPALLARAAWLAAFPALAGSDQGVAIRVPSKIRHPILARLANKRWPLSVLAQVRALENDLRREG